MKEFVFSCFSTKCVVKLEASEYEASNLAIKCFELCKNLHLKYNYFDNSSLVSKINNKSKNRIKLDQQTMMILQKLSSLSEITNYAFDITLINKKLKNNAKYGKNSYFLSKKFIEFEDINTKIDLGGVIKEFAVDECAKICEKYKYVINFGGDLKTNKEIFVNIKNPKNPQEAIKKWQILNQSLTTSAQYERANHIINTKDFKYSQVSVIGENTLSCGVFSTALCFEEFVLPKEYLAICIDFNNEIKYQSNRDR
ncbi:MULTISPECIES: FAD:protein FMN transferase [unclassified Campylobacter]|uniref:FAD:protein FMN transferase n=1 Tax=unclassified Campylobacter TaxID=2593542 RepID=UPI001DD5CBC7|nr:FAD:protein FMN transferase [Campylobacter sp. RM12651]MBZ7990625.1 FAD:protein FMN transferase [Campylobacter sp. RM9331]MBZ8004736.1 FAD:protein FMN transferase [Campylobacter sp. RM9332]ULO04453.1 FAD:protein FMN transferase, ApbE family [Campylobacter sp. RM12651]